MPQYEFAVLTVVRIVQMASYRRLEFRRGETQLNMQYVYSGLPLPLQESNMDVLGVWLILTGARGGFRPAVESAGI